MLAQFALDFFKDVLHIIEEYGADKVFMLWFFLLYRKCSKRNEDLQDKRIEDSREALKALIEAKHMLNDMSKNIESMEDKIEHSFERLQDIYSAGDTDEE